MTPPHGRATAMTLAGRTELRIVGMSEVADLLGVKLRTVHQWRFRGILPVPDLIVNDSPAWKSSTIQRWAKHTGRMS